MSRKPSVPQALAGPHDEEYREASPARPRPRATIDDSDGEGGKWGVQRRSAGDLWLPKLKRNCVMLAYP